MASDPVTIADFCDRCGAQASTVQNYREELGRMEQRLGKPLGEATEKDLIGLKQGLRGMASGPQRCRYLALFYKTMGRPELAAVLKLKDVKHRLAKADLLTLEDVNAMLGACTSLRDRALIAMLWATGARVHEALALNLGDLQQEAADGGRVLLHVTFRKTKVPGEEHEALVVEGVDHILAWVKAYEGTQGAGAPLFTGWNLGRMTNSAALKVVHRAAARAGIMQADRKGRYLGGKRVYNHLFRHSRATWLLRQPGMNTHDVKRLMGWAPSSTMLDTRYAHLVDEDAHDALKRVYGLPVKEAAASAQAMVGAATLRWRSSLVSPRAPFRAFWATQCRFVTVVTTHGVLRPGLDLNTTNLGSTTGPL